jgi:hypothetical protein
MGKVLLSDAEGFLEIGEGVYDFLIASGELRMSKAGRPYVNWRLQVETEDGNGSVFYSTPLPTEDTTSGLGFLKDLVEGVGMDSSEFELDTENPEATAEELIEALEGNTGTCRVKVKNDRPEVKIVKTKGE